MFNKTVLTVSLYTHLHHYEDVEVPDDEKQACILVLFVLFSIISLFTVGKFRYLAYRQLTWWGRQHLGRHRHVVLLSYAMAI